jgi:hypothetical protein
VLLSDPSVPESKQPYHDGFGTARENDAGLRRLLDSVARYGRRSMAAAIAELKAIAPIEAAAIVAGSLADPATIANDHIRIHALEGQLFRNVIAQGVSAAGIRCPVWRERDLPVLVHETLRLSEDQARASIAAAGRGRSGGWRGEQKTAALAAWLAMAGAS